MIFAILSILFTVSLIDNEISYDFFRVSYYEIVDVTNSYLLVASLNNANMVPPLDLRLTHLSRFKM